MERILARCAPILLCSLMHLSGQQADIPKRIDNMSFDPSTLLWYATPAKAWEEALPVGNGRLGAMVFGKNSEERIQLNEETYWSGGPYSTVVKGGYKALPEIRKLIFEGNPIGAHKLFGRHLMGYPVEQQKYQSIGNLHLFFENEKEVTGYKRWLDLETGIASVEYTANGVKFKREVFSSAPDQVIVVRLTADKPGSISFKASLRGCRNSGCSVGKCVSRKNSRLLRLPICLLFVLQKKLLFNTSYLMLPSKPRNNSGV